MHPIRHRLLALVVAVLSCQVIGIAAAPVALLGMGDRVVAPAADEDGCTCTHGPNAICPMHKHKTPASSPGDARWCPGCTSSPAVVLTTLIGFAAPVVSPHRLAAPAGASESLRLLIEQPLDLARPPVSPPPRS